MPWTLKTVEKNAAAGDIIVTLEFTDGVQTHRRSFDAQPFTTKEWISDQAQKIITWLDARDVAASAVSGAITPALLPVDKPAEVTPTAKQVYAQKLQAYRQLLRAIELGIPPLSASTTAATMLAWLKTNFAADYVDLF